MVVVEAQGIYFWPFIGVISLHLQRSARSPGGICMDIFSWMVRGYGNFGGDVSLANLWDRPLYPLPP